MKIKLLLILLTVLPFHALSADVICPEGKLDGRTHKEEVATEGASLCYHGKSYPKDLLYCAAENEGNKNWRGNEGFYNPLFSKCVEGKVIGKNQDVCSKGKLGPGGVYENIYSYCNEGGIYSNVTNLKTN